MLAESILNPRIEVIARESPFASRAEPDGQRGEFSPELPLPEHVEGERREVAILLLLAALVVAGLVAGDALQSIQELVQLLLPGNTSDLQPLTTVLPARLRGVDVREDAAREFDRALCFRASLRVTNFPRAQLVALFDLVTGHAQVVALLAHTFLPVTVGQSYSDSDSGENRHTLRVSPLARVETLRRFTVGQ